MTARQVTVAAVTVVTVTVVTVTLTAQGAQVAYIALVDASLLVVSLLYIAAIGED